MDVAPGEYAAHAGLCALDNAPACSLINWIHKHLLVPGRHSPCLLLSGSIRACLFTLEADSGEACNHTLLQLLQEDVPLCLERPPPAPSPRDPVHTVSSYFFFKSQLKSSVLFQTSQLTPRQAGRLNGSLVSPICPGPLANPPRIIP